MFDDHRRNRSRVAKKEKEKYEGREKNAKKAKPYGQCTQLLVRHQYASKAVREQVPHWINSSFKPTIQVALGHTEVYSVLALAPQIAPTFNDNCHVTLTHANGKTSSSWIWQMTSDDHYHKHFPGLLRFSTHRHIRAEWLHCRSSGCQAYQSYSKRRSVPFGRRQETVRPLKTTS